MRSSRAAMSCRQFIIVLMTSSLIAGCSGSKTGPKTVRVTGKVTYKNAGVDKAHVAFLGDGKIQAARAVTDKNGDFVLTTSDPGDGAVPGTHQVTVMKTVGSLTAPVPTATGPASMEAAAKAAQSGKKDDAPELTHLLPEKYSRATTSGLSYTVKEGDKNHFEITLTD